jgi:hypothetical protein
MKHRTSLYALVLIVIGCTDPINKGQLGDVYLPPDIRDSTQITNENVLRAVYSSYKYSEGFYHEDFQGSNPYYENTISIHASNERPSYWFELSTNDRSQAFAWSESSSVYSSYYRKLESERQTEKYFEFRRVWQEHPSDVILSRVHKATYLDRSMYDRFNPGDTIAVFQKSPIDTAGFKELVEYLWSADNFNIGGAKALCSYVLDHGTAVEYLLFHTMVSFGDWGLSDQISVMRSTYLVSKQTGVVTCRKQIIRFITGTRH